MIGCGGSPAATPEARLVPTTPPPAAAGPRRWVIVDTPQLTLAVDSVRPGLLVLPPRDPAVPAPVVREATTLEGAAGGLFLREELLTADGSFGATTAPAGAAPRASVLAERGEVRLVVAGIELGDAGVARWEIVLRGRVVEVRRAVTLRRAARNPEVALVMESPGAAGGRLLLLDGAAHRARDGLSERRERLRGATVGALDLAPEGFLFTARSHEATSATVAARAGGARLALGRAIAGGAGSGAESTTTLLFGPATHLQGPRSDFAPALDARLLATGYYGNVFASACCGPLLRASMTSYDDAAWVRDLAYATQGYRHVLDDLEPLRNTIQAFLDRTDAAGTVPELLTGGGDGIRRGAWDSQPDLIHAVYAYVASSGDVAFARRNRATLARIAGWLRAGDTDGDGIPDRTDVPYGYYDTVANGVRHTYAIASFYAAYRELAELEELAGDGTGATAYRADAERLRAAFDRPVEAGGFWLAGQPYPVAWFTAEGRVVNGFETFGVLAAIHGGLIPPGPRLDALAAFLRDHRDAFVDGAPFGERLMLGGYEPEFLRDVVPAELGWMLDASAPWIAGLDVPVRARLGQREDAAFMLERYLAAYAAAPWPLPEYAAGSGARYGAGQTPDAGRSWDNAAWFTIVYEGHYGLTPTPAALRVAPAPLRALPDDTLAGYRYGKARLTLTLGDGAYAIRADAPCPLVLLPMGADAAVSLDGAPPAPAVAIQAQPGRTYTVRSLPSGAATAPAPARPVPTALPAGATPSSPPAAPITVMPIPLPPTPPPGRPRPRRRARNYGSARRSRPGTSRTRHIPRSIVPG